MNISQGADYLFCFVVVRCPGSSICDRSDDRPVSGFKSHFGSDIRREERETGNAPDERFVVQKADAVRQNKFAAFQPTMPRKVFENAKNLAALYSVWSNR